MTDGRDAPEPADDTDWLVAGLRSGDPSAVRAFCDRYGPALLRIAERHLPQRLHRRVGPEDVVQSACRTFLRRAAGGEFRLGDGDGLWSLLCAITLTKVRELTRFHLRRRRGLDREHEQDPDASWGPLHGAADRGQSPAEAVAFAEQFEQLLAALDDEERAVVELKLLGYTNDQAAAHLGCSERTVRRVLKRVEARFADALRGP